MVPYAVTAAGATGLSESDRNKVIITSFNGATQMTPQDISTEDEAPPVTFDTWNQTTDEVTLQPEMSESPGCSTIFTTVITLDISTLNQLPSETKAAMNVTVTDRTTGLLLAQRLFVMDFKPAQTASIETTFVLQTDQLKPVLLVKATFPTDSELRSAPATIVNVPLFEYLLMRAGILPLF